MDRINVAASQKGSRGKRPQVVPGAEAGIPLGIVFDQRLSLMSHRVIGSLGYFADGADRCTVTDATLANSLKVSRDSIRRALSEIEQVGYIRREATKQTPLNWSGRIVHLLWISDPSIMPPLPARE